MSTAAPDDGPRTPVFTAPGTLTPVLSDLWDQERSWTLQTYLDHGGLRDGAHRADRADGGDGLDGRVDCVLGGAHQRSTPPRTGSMEARVGTRSAIMPPSPIMASDCRLEKEGSRKWTR